MKHLSNTQSIRLIISFIIIILYQPSQSQTITLPFKYHSTSPHASFPSQPFLSFIEQSRLTFNEDHNYIINVQLGQDTISMRLSTLYSWSEVFERKSTEPGYHPQSSSTYKLIKSTFNREEEMFLVKDTFQIKDFQFPIENYQFFLIPTSSGSPMSYDGTIGLNKRENGEDFLSDLLSNGIVKRQVMSITHTDENDGLLSIGDIPKITQLDPKQYKQCLLDDKLTDNQWNCRLHLVYFDNGKVYYAKGHLRVGLGANLIYVPKNVYIELTQTLFKEDIENNTCVDNGDQVCCASDYNGDKLGDISFVLGKWTLKLKIGKMFRLNQNKCLVIANSHARIWMITPAVMDDFTVVYNKEDKNLGFYRKTRRDML